MFAYSSDSRGGQGGGERNFNGPNAYIVRRLMAVTAQRNAAFMQFTGDLVSGYVTSTDQLTYELANWKRAIEPQAHWMPVYTGLGNHEAILREFSGARSVRMARFPYATESSEAIFARELVNPENGPVSEDGASYDPDPVLRRLPVLPAQRLLVPVRQRGDGGAELELLVHAVGDVGAPGRAATCTAT